MSSLYEFARQNPLPFLCDSETESLVFSHRSLFGLPAHIQLAEEEPQDYERLAFLGDQVLSMCTTEVVFERYHNARPSYLTGKRNLIVNNEQVAKWSQAYGLPSRIRAHSSQQQLVRTNIVARASVFEAYIGSIYTNDGFAHVQRFLAPLIRFTLDETEKLERDLELEENLKRLSMNERAEEEEEEEVILDRRSSFSASENSTALEDMGLLRTPRAEPRRPIGEESRFSTEPRFNNALPPSPLLFKPNGRGAVSDPSAAPSLPSSPRAVPPRKAASVPTTAPSGSGSSQVPGWLALFNQIASQKHINPVWETSQTGPPHRPTFVAKVFIDKKEWGRGQALAKQTARHNAAKNALHNLKWHSDGLWRKTPYSAYFNKRNTSRLWRSGIEKYNSVPRMATLFRFCFMRKPLMKPKIVIYKKSDRDTVVGGDERCLMPSLKRLLSLQRATTCFYCQLKLEKQPPNPFLFECPSCGCLNRYDEKTGEILSSQDPAMYNPEEKVNLKSFSRRATPSKKSIPTQVEQTIFCRECTINQTLVTNLLANYLPPPSDPDYENLLVLLPEYKSSLEIRYPVVCEKCQPLVEEKLQKKEHMARSKALGVWLNNSSRQRTPIRPTLKPRTSSILRPTREKTWLIRLWMLQCFLYIITTFWVCLSYFLNMGEFKVLSLKAPSPIFIVASLAWTFWNPAWLNLHRSQSRGFTVRLEGRKDSTRVQFLLWLSRLVVSCLNFLWGKQVTREAYSAFLAVEFVLGAFSLIGVKVIQPPPITLSRHEAASNQTPARRTPFLAVPESFTPSMSNRPKPTFGLPSLISPATISDEMDWTPQVNPSLLEDDPFILKQGKLPGASTGLESLLAGASLGAERHSSGIRSQSGERSDMDLREWVHRQDVLVMGGVIITIIILLIAAILPALQTQKGMIWSPGNQWDFFGQSTTTSSSNFKEAWEAFQREEELDL